MTAPVRGFGRYQAIVALAAFLGAACGTGAAPPLAPRPAATLQPPAAVPSRDVAGFWNLTQTLTSVTGSEVCGCCQQLVGTSGYYPLEVRRSGTEVTFFYGTPDSLDGFTLVGILDGEAFTASMSDALYVDCGQRLDLILEARVVGQFSADGNALTARETWTRRFASGEVMGFSFDWVATRPAR